MCDPVSISLAAATAVTAAGQGYSAMQQAAMGRYQSKVNEQNARLSSEQARDAQERTKLEARQLYRKIGATSGQQTAAMAANGIDLSFGSAVDVQRDTAMQGAEDVAQLYKSGYEEARGLEINASNYRSQAAADRANAHASIVSGVFGVGSTILGGATQYAKYKAGR